MPDYRSRIQDVINGLEEGWCVILLRGFIALVLVVALYALYGYSQFRGFRDAEAMEYAQLARNMAGGKGFSTRCMRPSDLWYLQRDASEPDAESSPPPRRIDSFPDIRHGPMYPFMLSLGFRMARPSVEIETETGGGFRVYGPERKIIAPINILFGLLTGLLIFLVGSRIFNPLVAIVSVCTYFVTDAVLVGGFSGMPVPLATLLVTASIYGVLLCTWRRAQGTTLVGWLLPLVLAAVCAGLAFLTRYSLVMLVPALALFLKGREESDEESEFEAGSASTGWLGVGIFVIVFALVVSPWLARNWRVSGAPLGTAPYTVLNETHRALFPGDAFDRDPEPDLHNVRVAAGLKRKAIANLAQLYDVNLRTIGSGIVVCFFLVSFFHSFDSGRVRRLRWCLALGLGLLMVVMALQGRSTWGLLAVLLPLVIVYATGFLFELMDREGLFERGLSVMVLWVMVLLAALPAVLKVTASKAAWPYPPYYPPHVQYVSHLLDRDEVLCTDIPWATAWYGDRHSVLLPRSIEGFKTIEAKYMKLSGLYLTPETGNRPYVGGFASGSYRSWLPVLNGVIPPDFPLTYGMTLPAGSRDQLFLTNRVRWQ